VSSDEAALLGCVALTLGLLGAYALRLWGLRARAAAARSNKP
jgi:hypothetical protein